MRVTVSPFGLFIHSFNHKRAEMYARGVESPLPSLSLSLSVRLFLSPFFHVPSPCLMHSVYLCVRGIKEKGERGRVNRIQCTSSDGGEMRGMKTKNEPATPGAGFFSADKCCMLESRVKFSLLSLPCFECSPFKFKVKSLAISSEWQSTMA